MPCGAVELKVPFTCASEKLEVPSRRQRHRSRKWTPHLPRPGEEFSTHGTNLLHRGFQVVISCFRGRNPIIMLDGGRLLELEIHREGPVTLGVDVIGTSTVYEKCTHGLASTGSDILLL